MSCDCDFGRIEKKRQRKDKVVGPSEWVGLIKEMDHANLLNILYVEHPVTDNMMSDGTPVIKVRNYKQACDQYLQAPNEISTVRGLLCKRSMGLLCRYSMTGDCLIPLASLKQGKK